MKNLWLALRSCRVLDLSCSAKHIPSRLPLTEPEESDKLEPKSHGENVGDIRGHWAEMGSCEWHQSYLNHEEDGEEE